MFILWHGGHNYAPGYVEDMEEVTSLEAAKALCEARYNNSDGSTPCVDETSGASVYRTDDRPEETDNPDDLIIRTARGNWKVI